MTSTAPKKILSVLILVFSFVCLMVAGLCIVLQPEPILIGLLTAMYLVFQGLSYAMFMGDSSIRQLLRVESTAMGIAAAFFIVGTLLINPKLSFMFVLSLVLMASGLTLWLLTLPDSAKEEV